MGERPYKYRTWNELMKARDALQILHDLGFSGEAETIMFDDVNNEIDIRYQHGTTKGGDLAHAGRH